MEKRLKQYLAYIDKQCGRELADEEKARLKSERLIHLIVTVLFAVITIMSVLCSFMVINLALLLLIVMLLVLLVPYIRHYYILENGVQKLYEYYDKLAS